jgi:prophage regulatory protein
MLSKLTNRCLLKEVNTTQHQSSKIIKKPEITAIIGYGPTGQFEQIREGLLPKYINLGLRSVGLFEHECRTIVAARSIGKSNDEIRLIVKALIKQRETSANDLLKHLFRG